MATNTATNTDAILAGLKNEKEKAEAIAAINKADAASAQSAKDKFSAYLPKGENLEGKAEVENYDKLAELFMIESMDSLSSILAGRIEKAASSGVSRLLVLPKGQLESLGRLENSFNVKFELLRDRFEDLILKAESVPGTTEVVRSTIGKLKLPKTKAITGLHEVGIIDTLSMDMMGLGDADINPSLMAMPSLSAVTLAVSTALEVVSMFKSDLNGTVTPVDVSWDVLAASVAQAIRNTSENMTVSVWGHLRMADSSNTPSMIRIENMRVLIKRLTNARIALAARRGSDTDAAKIVERMEAAEKEAAEAIAMLLESKNGEMSIAERLCYYSRLKEAAKDGFVMEIDMIKAVAGSSVRKWRFFSASVDLLYGMAVSYWLTRHDGELLSSGNVVLTPRRKPFLGFSNTIWEE